jgi:hypothetical protein
VAFSRSRPGRGAPGVSPNKERPTRCCRWATADVYGEHISGVQFSPQSCLSDGIASAPENDAGGTSADARRGVL